MQRNIMHYGYYLFKVLTAYNDNVFDIFFQDNRKWYVVRIVSY